MIAKETKWFLFSTFNINNVLSTTMIIMANTFANKMHLKSAIQLSVMH